MADTQADIKREMARFAAQFGPDVVAGAKVLSIQSNDTITVKMESGLEVDEVRLRALISAGSKYVVTPAVDSEVLIIHTGDDEWAVLMVSEVSKLQVKMGTAEMLMTEDGFKWEKGNASLKEIIQNLIEAVQVIVVMQGNNPDRQKLTAALLKLNLLCP